MERNVKRMAFVALLAAAGCGPSADVPPDPASAFTEPGAVSGRPLARILRELEAQLDTALAEGSGAASLQRLAAAEAVTDGLLEAELPFDWMGDGGYSLEARLRQIQAMADRVMALGRSGMDRDSLTAAVTEFRDRVRGLATELARGGGPRPVPIEALLRALDTMGR